MPERHIDFDVVFQSSALAAGDLFLRQMRGREALSSLFEFDLLVETTFGGALEFDQIDEIIAGTAYLAFGTSEEHKIHGVVRRVEMLSMADEGPVLYRLHFVPRLFDTTLTSGSWVYQDLSVPDIVKDVLTRAGFVEGDDFEFRLTSSYAPREYVVQYQETDFNFISRLLEHQGIFYYFEHGDERAKVVFIDTNNSVQALSGYESISYDPRGGTTDPIEVILSLSRTQTAITGRVGLRDYNYRTPSVQLVVDAPVDSRGIGQQVHYGDHFKDINEGRRLARIRAQEELARKEVYRGLTRVRGLRAGHKFTLEGHALSVMDQEYLVTEVVHSVTQTAQAGAGESTQGYSNEITAIPLAVQYRPPRVTPKPRIYGVMNAKIDALQDNQYAVPIDEFGRYKVLMPFDIAGRPGGRASRWMRMVQPSSGQHYGVHFPLHVGTEVLLVHVDGDPDRPVIVGSVPNHETISPVTSANASQAFMRTRNSIEVVFDDQA